MYVQVCQWCGSEGACLHSFVFPATYIALRTRHRPSAYAHALSAAGEGERMMGLSYLSVVAQIRTSSCRCYDMGLFDQKCCASGWSQPAAMRTCLVCRSSEPGCKVLVL